MLKFGIRIITMSKSIPGPKAKAILKRGVSLFQNGLIYVIGGERGIRTLDTGLPRMLP